MLLGEELLGELVHDILSLYCISWLLLLTLLTPPLDLSVELLV
jgi:hypothetical protein